jgi:hypothetical protein
MADDDKKKAARQALVPNAEGNVAVDVIMGPYRDNRLTMTAADGQAAINAHWARNPQEPYGEHDPLTDQQRTDALEASHAWAKAQQDALLENQPAKLPAGQKTMKPEEGEAYKTRSVAPEPPKPAEPPKR